MCLADFLEAEDPRRLGLVDALGDAADDGLEGNFRERKGGRSRHHRARKNTHKCVPLGIWNTGSNVSGPLPPRNPTRQAQPPRRGRTRESRTVVRDGHLLEISGRYRKGVAVELVAAR